MLLCQYFDEGGIIFLNSLLVFCIPLIFRQAVDGMLEAKATTALATSVVVGLGTVEMEV